MKTGYLHAGIPYVWSPKAVKHTNFKGKDDVYIRGDMADVLMRYSTEPAPVAHICKECHKIVVDY